jgi:hypothetical protein
VESASSSKQTAPSIHDIEASIALGELPPVDLDDRALFIERVLPGSVTLESYVRGQYEPLASTAGLAMVAEVESGPQAVVVTLRSRNSSVTKRLSFFPDGGVSAKFSWDASLFPADAWFTTEISASRPIRLKSPGATVWEHPIETVAKSERGLDRTLQGWCYLTRWPASLGTAEVEVSEQLSG